MKLKSPYTILEIYFIIILCVFVVFFKPVDKNVVTIDFYNSKKSDFMDFGFRVPFEFRVGDQYQEVIHTLVINSIRFTEDGANIIANDKNYGEIEFYFEEDKKLRSIVSTNWNGRGHLLPVGFDED